MSQVPPLSLGELGRAVAADLRRSCVVLVGYETFFKLLAALVLVPALAALLFHLVRWKGYLALTNTDIVGFVLSPLGVCYAYLVGLKILGVALLEHAGAMALAALKQTGHWHGLRHAAVVLAMRSLRVLRLGGLLLVVSAAVLAPFAALAAGTYAWLLGDHDINFYLAERPREFYLAAAIGAVLLLGAVSLLAWLFVRWAFALPIVLFEDVQPLAALRLSAARTRGVRWRLALLLLGWALAMLLTHVLLVAGFKLFAGGLLSATGRRPGVILGEMAVLLVVKGLLLAGLSAAFVIGQSLLVLRCYVERGVRLGVLDRGHWGDGLEREPGEPPPTLIHRLEWGLAGGVGAVAVLCLALTWPFTLREEPQVTAHRGYWQQAPENSLAAIQQAIDVGADWVEIDVQLTADGEVVLLHDNDLFRMLGDRRTTAQLRLDELKQLRYRDERFPAERLPTLAEAIELARDQIKLNIELKFVGRDRALSRKVAEVVRREEFEGECFVASLVYEGVVEAKRHNPRLKTAAIIAYAVGDISKLDVDVLSVKKELATEELLRKARRLDKQVHVWTVNDRRDMRRFIEQGVHNIITDHPDRFREIVRERQGLGDTQRLLLTCRYLLD